MEKAVDPGAIPASAGQVLLPSGTIVRDRHDMGPHHLVKGGREIQEEQGQGRALSAGDANQ
eukprot:14288218-Alexandrium_andersonii.AAC.1